ncbi:MAG: hypothetical protein CMN78_05410 [Spirochaetales bacterium]|nr:hypothetical protein [Spirochaetales bacterium]
MEPRIRVVGLGIRPVLGNWAVHESVDYRTIDSSTELIDVDSQRQVIIDACEAAPATEATANKICRAVEKGCYVAVQPTDHGLLAAFDKVNLYATNRVFFFIPMLYRPVCLELMRLLAEKHLGPPAGIESSFALGADETLYGPLALLYLLVTDPRGKTIVWRQGENNAVTGLIWSDSRAATFCCYYDEKGANSRVSVACKRGTIIGTLGRADCLFAAPAGETPYHLPLPEGNGLYYFQIDMIQGAQAGSPSVVLPSVVGRRALRWIQEIINEGT